MADDDAVTFEKFVTMRWSALYRTAYLLTGRRLDAEDVLQATLVKVYASWGRVRRAASLEAYVQRMLVNGFLSGTRRRRRAREYLERQEPVAPVPSHESAVLDRVQLWEQVVGLPARQRAVVVLRFYEDLSEKQVAEVLGCAPGTVKSQTSAALRSLQARLGDEKATPR